MVCTRLSPAMTPIHPADVAISASAALASKAQLITWTGLESRGMQAVSTDRKPENNSAVIVDSLGDGRR
jgi:hypothetical protein